jgi:outer membrane receptor for ferrienterochelin and colicins
VRWICSSLSTLACLAMPVAVLAQASETPDQRAPEDARDGRSDDAPPEELFDDLEVPAVVVTATRIESDAGTSVVPVDVISRERVDRSGARDAAELLEEEPALQLQRSFRGTEVWMRGLPPEHTLVLVDGQRVPGATGGAIDLSRFGVGNIERIEIVRGPSSALYGSEAIGGVINVLTRDMTEDFALDANARYGGPGHVVDAGALAGVRIDRRLELRATGGFHFADAFRRDVSSETTSGSSRLEWHAGGRGQWRPDDHTRLRLQADYGQRELAGVDAGAGSALFDRTQLQEQLSVSFEHALDGPDSLRLRTRLSYSLFREQYLLDQRGSGQLDRYEDNREELGQLASIVQFRIHELGEHRVTAGFEQLVQALDSARLSGDGLRTRLAFFAEDEWILVEDGELSFTAAPGIRVDLDSQFGAQVSPKLALRFDPVRQLVLRASYGRGFRAPSFQELLLRFENPSVGYVVTGNPELGAETAGGLDVGATWTPDAWLALSAAFFRNDLEGMITTVSVEDTDPGQLFTYANLATAWTMGLESAARIRLDALIREAVRPRIPEDDLELSLRVAYTLTETWDGENQRHLEGRARHRFSFGLSFTYEPWELDFVARCALQVDRIFYVDTDGDGVEEELYGDPIAQIDLRLAKRFTRHFELFAGVDNLIDAGDAFTVLRPLTVYGGARGRY